MQHSRRFLTLLTMILLLAALPACSRTSLSESPAAPVETKALRHPDTTLVTVLDAEGVRDLENYPDLRHLDLSGSTCYEEILTYIAAHPQVDTTYTVALVGSGEDLVLSNHDTELVLPNVSYSESLLENAPWLQQLSKIDLPGDASENLQSALQAAFPSAEIGGLVELLGRAYPRDLKELDLSSLQSSQVDAVLPALAEFSALEQIRLVPAEGDSQLTLEDAARLAAAAPSAAFDYRFTLFGKEVSASDERLEYENTSIGNEGVEQLRRVLPLMTRLSYLKLDSCDIDNEVLAQLRDDFPAIKVVWRIFFGNGYNCLTDTEMIWATGGSVNDTTTKVLQYCTDVKYLDLGHDLMTHIDFVRNMPKLEVLVIAISWVEDISPLAECENLEYLEMFSCRVTDLSPLANCKHLQHLNVSHLVNTDNLPIAVTDISSLYELNELKRFYCTMSNVPQEQKDKMIELHPDCEIEFGWVDPAEGAWRFDENGEPNERYALLREQFGYESLQQSGKAWSLYG